MCSVVHSSVQLQQTAVLEGSGRRINQGRCRRSDAVGVPLSRDSPLRLVGTISIDLEQLADDAHHVATAGLLKPGLGKGSLL